MSRFETIGPELDLTELAKHNRNLDRADSDLTSLQQQISAEQQARVAADGAHAGSTSAHPAQNITYSGAVTGANNVKQAIDTQDARINNIVAGAGSGNTEIVDARPGLDGVAHPVLKDRLDRMEQRQLSAQNQTTTINRGINLVNSDQASGATFKVLGRTLCNILGRDGGCESMTGWDVFGTPAVSTTHKRSGASSFKVSSTAATQTVYKNFSYALESSKHYLYGCWVFIESYSTGNIVVDLRDFGTNNIRYSASINSTLIGQWQFVYTKIPTSNTLVGNGFRALFGVTGATAVVYFDEARIYEVTTAEYTAIGSAITGDAIDRRWPYVDGVQHLQGVSLMTQGKNLVKPIFGRITTGFTCTVTGSNSMDMTVTTIAGNASIVADVVPNINYVFNCNAGPNGTFAVYDINATTSLSIYSSSPRTFNSGNRTQVRLYVSVKLSPPSNRAIVMR